MANASGAVTLLLLPAIVLSVQVTRAQDSAEAPFTLKQVGPGAWAAISNNKAKAPAGGNGGFVIGDDGVAVIDTFASTEAATQLLTEIRKLTKLPVKFVVNTHYHLDHVAGNRVFADAGAVVLAQRNVRDWVHPENLKFFGKEPKPEQKAFVAAVLPPAVVYDQQVTLYLGSREIQVRSFPGHTGGDSVVLIPDAKTVFGGDLFWRNTLPNMIDASTTSWIDTLTTLAKNDAGSTFVPGHGEVGNAQDVAAFRDYLATLRKLVAEAQAQGRSGDALAEAVMPALTDRYGQWDFFNYLARLNILETDAELSGKKRIPRAQAK
jgi:glyoxylase-like metal-dependent hydrolase (beta-lactamase superfamily II)